MTLSPAGLLSTWTQDSQTSLPSLPLWLSSEAWSSPALSVWLSLAQLPHPPHFCRFMGNEPRSVAGLLHGSS